MGNLVHNRIPFDVANNISYIIFMIYESSQYHMCRRLYLAERQSFGQAWHCVALRSIAWLALGGGTISCFDLRGAWSWLGWQMEAF